MLTHEIPPDFRAASIHSFIKRHLVSPEFIGSRKLRADDVHCREPTGTGAVVLKIVIVTGAAVLQVTMEQLM